jgi:hypothetical protein
MGLSTSSVRHHSGPRTGHIRGSRRRFAIMRLIIVCTYFYSALFKMNEGFFEFAGITFFGFLTPVVPDAVQWLPSALGPPAALCGTDAICIGLTLPELETSGSPGSHPDARLHHPVHCGQTRLELGRPALESGNDRIRPWVLFLNDPVFASERPAAKFPRSSAMVTVAAGGGNACHALFRPLACQSFFRPLQL